VLTSPARHAAVAVLVACAAGKLVLRQGASPSAPAAVELPDALDGQPARPLPLGPSERLLARAPGVSLVRRAYGTSQAALVTTSGVRELHPPRVCLRAAGLEVVTRQEERTAAGCLVHLRVRDPRARTRTVSHLYHTYPRPDGAASCDFWRRAGGVVLARVSGRSVRWASLQVMDRDAARARRATLKLLSLLGGRDG